MQFHSENYELITKVGQGGFGEVYKARQINTKQLVAIKFLTLHADFDNDTRSRYIERFERETLLCGKLQHPNIVRLLDKGRHGDGLLFAVFEYVDGKTLKQVLNESGALPPTIAAAIMAQVLDGLVHAHQQGVIHRDIKPANIMLTNSGAKVHAMVLDFGIGTLVSEARQLDYKSLTLTREVLGTPSHSAPEQLRGEPPTLKTDLYVWGLVFLECLTGKPAISGSSLAAIFHQQLSPSNVPIPASIAGHPVAALLRRVLNKKASERVASAAALYRDLMQINFSTLVGDIANPKPLASINNTVEETGIYGESSSYRTNLTERKQITVLSVLLDIQGGDESVLQAELRDTLLTDQKSQCQDIAIRYGAFHVGTLGDNLLFYFGYPVVSENDCRLCARTALDIISNLSSRNALLKAGQGIEFLIRIGVHTGPVTCYADAVPEGSTPNIAMALSRVASVNQILCSDSTRRILDTYIEFEPLPIEIGDTNTVKVARYRLIGERQLEAFGFLRGTRKNSAFFGRDAELAILLKLLDPNENAQLVHVFGEAGIGKSRLLFEFRHAAKNMPHYVAQCLPEYQNNALYPILNVLRYKHSLDTLAPTAAMERLRQLIRQIGQSASESSEQDSNQALTILCAWLNLPLPDDLFASALPPDQQKRILFSTINALLTGQTENGVALADQAVPAQRMLFLFEDMHWADPTSVEFLAQFVQSPEFVAATHIFVSTSRQPLPAILNTSSFTPLALTRLTEQAAKQFISALFDNVKVSGRVSDLLIARTDGIPLFVEELVTMLKQKKLVALFDDIIDFISAEKLQDVPGSLRDSLQQKLDSLVSAKITAQMAATIGREFDYALLVAASDLGESQIQNNLNELLDAELIFKQRKTGGDSYLFKHALVRDAAYESISEKGRHAFHKAIASTLEEKFPAIATTNPGLMAQHFADGQEFQSAAEYGLKLSKQQIKQSLNQEAMHSTAKNLEWAQQVENDITRIGLQLASYEVQLPATMTTKGYGAEDLIAIFDRIHSLTQIWSGMADLVDTHRWDDLIDRSKWAQFLSHHYRSERFQARKLGESLLKKARAAGDKKKMMAILSHLAQAHQVDGDYKIALEESNEAIRIFDEINDENAALEYGIHIKAQSMAMSTMSYYFMGQIRNSVSIALQAIKFSEELKHDMSIVFAYMFTALTYSYMREDEKVIEYVNAYYERHGKTRGEVWHAIYIDLMFSCATKDLLSAEKYMAEIVASGQGFAAIFYSPFLANVYCNKNDFNKAITLLESSIKTAMESRSMGCYSFLHQMLGNCIYQKTKSYSPAVADHLHAAIKFAREQDALYVELDALCDIYELAAGLADSEIINRIGTLLSDGAVDFDSPVFKRALSIFSH